MIFKSFNYEKSENDESIFVICEYEAQFLPVMVGIIKNLNINEKNVLLENQVIISYDLSIPFIKINNFYFEYINEKDIEDLSLQYLPIRDREKYKHLKIFDLNRLP